MNVDEVERESFKFLCKLRHYYLADHFESHEYDVQMVAALLRRIAQFDETPQSMGRLGGLARAKALTKAQLLASSRKANRAKAKKQRHEGLSSTQFRSLG